MANTISKSVFDKITGAGNTVSNMSNSIPKTISPTVAQAITNPQQDQGGEFLPNLVGGLAASITSPIRKGAGELLNLVKPSSSGFIPFLTDEENKYRSKMVATNPLLYFGQTVADIGSNFIPGNLGGTGLAGAFTRGTLGSGLATLGQSKSGENVKKLLGETATGGAIGGGASGLLWGLGKGIQTLGKLGKPIEKQGKDIKMTGFWNQAGGKPNMREGGVETIENAFNNPKIDMSTPEMAYETASTRGNELNKYIALAKENSDVPIDGVELYKQLLANNPGKTEPFKKKYIDSINLFAKDLIGDLNTSTVNQGLGVDNFMPNPITIEQVGNIKTDLARALRDAGLSQKEGAASYDFLKKYMGDVLGKQGVDFNAYSDEISNIIKLKKYLDRAGQTQGSNKGLSVLDVIFGTGVATATGNPVAGLSSVVLPAIARSGKGVRIQGEATQRIGQELSKLTNIQPTGLSPQVANLLGRSYSTMNNMTKTQQQTQQQAQPAKTQSMVGDYSSSYENFLNYMGMQDSEQAKKVYQANLSGL